MSSCQAVGVHVSLRRSRNPVTVHGSHHGVSSPLQQQTHQLKATFKLKKKKKKQHILSIYVDEKKKEREMQA